MSKNTTMGLITDLFKFKGLLLHDKCYKAAIYFGILFICNVLIFPTGLEQIEGNYLIQIIATTIIWMFIIMCSIAYISESIYLYQKKISTLFKSVIFNFFLGVTIFLVYVYSEIRMGIFINNITGIDSRLLPNAFLSLKIIFIPYIWSIVLLPLLFINIFLRNKPPKSVNNNEFNKEQNTETKSVEKVKPLFGIIGGLFVFMLVVSFGMHVNTKNSKFYGFSKELIIISEYYKKSYCNNYSSVEYVADIGRGNISIYNPHMKIGNQFRVEKCQF